MVEGDASKMWRGRSYIANARLALVESLVVTRPKAYSIGQRTPVSVSPGTDAPLRGASSWGFFDAFTPN